MIVNLHYFCQILSENLRFSRFCENAVDIPAGGYTSLVFRLTERMPHGENATRRKCHMEKMPHGMNGKWKEWKMKRMSNGK